MTEPDEDNLSIVEIIDWIEFAGWTTLALLPILRWINELSALTDQYVIQILVLVAAFLGAFGVREFKI